MKFTEHSNNGVIWTQCAGIAARHCFTTRLGGVSTGIFAELNLGENRGDDPDAVLENYRRLGDATGIDTAAMVFTRQVHGAEVRVTGPDDLRAPMGSTPYEADGLVTSTPGTPLIIFTSDCAPLLMADEKNGVIAAVHCGWRSTALDIIAVAVREMTSLGAQPDSIAAAVGPAIGRCCFETGADVVEAFGSLLHSADGPWAPIDGRPGKFLVDLPGVIRLRLLGLGLRDDSICLSDECTVCQSEKYWSHRATQGQRGSQASLITL